MINIINFDLDECLIHSMWPSEDCDQEHLVVELENNEVYNVVVHPNAKEVIDYARTLVGPENVYILTTSMSVYANKINEMAGFGFPKSHIRAREQHATPIRMGYGHHWPSHEKYSKDNVLIDNLPPYYNEVKMSYLGIKKDRYLQVRDYYGVNFPNDPFADDVYRFLDQKYNEAKT